MRRHVVKRWRRTLRALRAECPPVLPVRVRLMPGPSESFGLTDISRAGDHFNVTVWRRIRERTGLVRDVTASELVDTLIHEWGHALAWAASHSTEGHDAAWGVAYARCYQAVVED